MNCTAMSASHPPCIPDFPLIMCSDHDVSVTPLAPGRHSSCHMRCTTVFSYRVLK